MDTAFIAPSGDGPIAVAPVSDNNPISISDAASAITEWRNKQDEQPAEAPAQAAEPPPVAEEANAAPAEEATGEQPTETSEPAEELPPIEPPRSWTKEQKAEFQNLPREAQEVISAREQDRETTLRRGQNELAEQRKQTEALRTQLSEALKQYEAATKSALEIAQQSQAGEFADIRTPDDISKLAAEDPLRFTRYQAHLMRVAQVEQAHKQAQEQIQSEYQNKWREFASNEDAKFLEKAPEMADKATAQKIADASVNLLKGVDFSEQDLAKLWNGEASLSLRDHRLQLILLKAAKYDEAQKSAPKKVAAKPIPPVQRPGSSAAKSSPDEVTIKQLSNKLEKTGNWKDAAELLLARRNAASR